LASAFTLPSLVSVAAAGFGFGVIDASDPGIGGGATGCGSVDVRGRASAATAAAGGVIFGDDDIGTVGAVGGVAAATGTPLDGGGDGSVAGDDGRERPKPRAVWRAASDAGIAGSEPVDDAGIL
jgi:hypothetical protein